MHIKKRIIFGMAIILALMLAGCSQEEKPSEEKQSDVTLGKMIFVDPSGVAFWGDDSYLCSGVVGENGIEEVVIEAQMTYEIKALAVYESRLYVGSKDGIYSYALSDLQGGDVVSPEQISDSDPDNRFTIRNGKLYYRYGYSVYSVDLADGTEIEVAQNTYDYEIMNEKIVYTGMDGGIFTASEDGKTWSKLTDTPSNCKMSVASEQIYYTAQEDDELFQSDISGSVPVKVKVSEDLSEYDDIWANENYLLYESSGYEPMLLNLKDNSDTKVTEAVTFPTKGDGFLVDNKLYGYDKYKQTLYLYDLENGSYVEENISQILQQQIAAHSAQVSGDLAQNSGASSNAEGYDISEGLFQYDNTAGENEKMLGGTYFDLTLPGTVPWGWEKTSNTSVKIYYQGALDSGYGGTVVTVRAYDPDDTSYLELPRYQIAGKSSDKVYVAIFPTDLQYDASNAVQTDEYNELMSYAKEIDEKNGTDNPFKCY